MLIIALIAKIVATVRKLYAEMFKFGVVGAIGVIADVSSSNLLWRYTGLSHTVASVGGTCVATVTASWTNAPVQDVQLYVRDLTTSTWEPDPSTAPAPEQPVSGTSGSLSDTFQLNPLLAGAVMVHSFDAMANFYSGGSLLKQAWANSYNAPCYLGQLGQVGL